MSAEVDAYLAQAWSSLAPSRDKSLPYPRGFWPDVARVAVHLALDIPLDFRPTQCVRGSMPEPTQRASKAKTRAENTAALMALIETPADLFNGAES
jgi:hypothetical protein